jgi:hypothetical protein
MYPGGTEAATESAMIALLLVIGFVAVGIGIALFAATTAPVGYQDETGFHYGPDYEVKEEVVCPVTEPNPA